MIENLRKYTGLTIVIFVIAILAFILGDYNRGAGSMGGGNAVLKIAGRTYSDKEFNRLGKESFNLAYGLAQSGDFSLYQFVMGLSVGAKSQDDAPEKFFIGRMMIREAKVEFGVYPGEEEITAYLRALRAFSGPDGKFNPETYTKFLKNGVGQLGMTEGDLRELISDVLATKKINSIIGGGLVVDREAIAKDLALQNQQISGDVAMLELAPFQEKIQPTEEEIKKHWDNISDSFATEPRRKFTYIVVSPKLPTEAKIEEAPPSIADETASDEVKKEVAKKKEDAQAKRAAEFAEERRKKQFETDTLVSDFIDKLDEQKGAGFEELAKANQWDLKTSELFTQAVPPQDLSVALRSSSRGGKISDELFKIQETKDPLSKFSQAIAIGENQWLIARLDGEEKSRVKTYDEARAEVRAEYISEKATEALKTAANEAVTKIKALMTAGKTFAQAAEEAGIKKTKAFTSVNSSYRPDGATEPQNLFEAARQIDPGGIAEVITESDRAFILYVAKREVVKEANADTRIDAEVTSQTSGNEMIAFSSWLTARIEAAKVELLQSR